MFNDKKMTAYIKELDVIENFLKKNWVTEENINDFVLETKQDKNLDKILTLKKGKKIIAKLNLKKELNLK